MEPKKLYKVDEGKMVCGVCAGLAQYFNMDVTIIRLAVALVSLFTGGTGIIAYFVAAFIMPTV